MFDIDKERFCWSAYIHNYYLEQYDVMFITSTAILKMPTIKKKDMSECVPIKDSVQPGHPLILIRDIAAVR